MTTCTLVWRQTDDDDEVRLRLRPLREQWDARGPGLLAYLAKQLPNLAFPSEITVQLVKPIHGGGGKIIAPTEIRFEAVLANPIPELPEVLRLAWLCARLATTTYDDPKSGAALIPAVLCAAEYVELATLDEPAVNAALQAWFHARSPRITSAARLLEWWGQTGRNAKVWQQAVDDI